MNRGTHNLIAAVSWMLSCNLWTTADIVCMMLKVNTQFACMQPHKTQNIAADPLTLLSQVTMQENTYRVLYLRVLMHSLENP